MYVADQRAFCGERVKVEFIPVQSAAERDQVMAAGQADGMINDLVSTLFYNKDDVQIQIVRFARTATPEFPQYRILAAKDSGIETVEDLKGVPIGISEGSVIAYTPTGCSRLRSGGGHHDCSRAEIPTACRSGLWRAKLRICPILCWRGRDRHSGRQQAPQYGNSVLFRKAVIDEQPVVRGFWPPLTRPSRTSTRQVWAAC
jgi:NitT/TauT family transport system substrate-binding protein